MSQDKQPTRRGRPTTGVTPKRNIRIGQTWTRGEQIAAEQGITMTAYVEQAIKEKNDRAGRAPDPDIAR